jgi:hypothetical protein
MQRTSYAADNALRAGTKQLRQTLARPRSVLYRTAQIHYIYNGVPTRAGQTKP